MPIQAFDHILILDLLPVISTKELLTRRMAEAAIQRRFNLTE